LTLTVSDATRAAVTDWLAEETALSGASDNTVKAYSADVMGFMAFMTTHLGGNFGINALKDLTVRDMRAWMAHERSRGVSARSLARSLSATKSFFRWLAKREGFEPTAVLSTRAPKFKNKLPRPLSETAAREMIDTVSVQSVEPWIGARDEAVVTLLYGCGLRISEALSLTTDCLPLPETLLIRGKGGKERMVPVLPVARTATETYVRLCPHDLTPSTPLFRGARGGPLNPRLIARVMERARHQMGLPASATPHAMRHSFATHLLGAGGDLRAIQELLGHAQLSTTQAYTAVDAAQMMEIYNKAHPKA